MKDIEKLLIDNSEEKAAAFSRKLLPTVDGGRILGVRIPKIREIAKSLSKSADFIKEDRNIFLKELPHKYIEEDILHGALISDVKSFDDALELTNAFLPYVDNWMVCDTFSPKAFGKDRDRIKKCAYEWIASGRTYTVRFGILCAMRFFLGDNLDEKLLDRVLAIHTDEYYINMAIAWCLCDVLIKNYYFGVKYLQNGTLDEWVHNKAIQKAVESFRVDDGKKKYLKSLKIKHE